jgi:hypothetical protein
MIGEIREKSHEFHEFSPIIGEIREIRGFFILLS